MIICKDCNTPMHSVMSFSKDKHEKFNHCPKYFGETRHKKLRENELNFGELLSKEIHKRE